jgi:UDP-4-amino-4,6-dideoxy-N-acetyl-beta-L-altrosamine transaminase
MIPYGRQHISDEDIKAVVEVLKSDYLTQGPVVPLFEQAICDYTNVRHVVATNSGTSALHLACRALDLDAGDILWTSPITFVASANCALYCGAKVDFVDIDRNTFNLSVDALKEKLEQAEEEGKLPKIVVPVHFCGLPCDMEVIGELAKQYGFSVIEDASHAIGGSYQNEAIGSCRYSDITVFSFHPVKTITTGEGGATLTNRSDLAKKMALLRSHGITREPNCMTHEKDGDWYYQQIELGYNYRMTDIQAALGLSQMGRLDEFVKKRHEIASLYDELLRELPVTTQQRQQDSYSGMHLYVICLVTERLDKSHKQIFTELRQAGIGVNLHYIPVHTQPWFQAMGFKIGDYPQAEEYYAQAISLPMFPELSEDQVNTIVGYLRESLA